MDKEIKHPKSEEPLVRDMNSESPLFTPKVLLLLIVVIVLGGGSGYVFAQKKTANTPISMNEITDSSSIEKGMVVGSDDTKTFKDTAEGVVRAGGIEGEGQFHLVRPGGDSQNVYMTSSLVDLSKFIGKKIKVWGETQKAQKAGWLMDVGRVEVLE